MKTQAYNVTYIFIVLAGFIFANIRLFAQQGEPLPKNYIVHYTVNSIEVDGVDHEKDWANTPWTDDFIDIEGKKTPKYRTRVKMLWNAEYFYFFAEMEEPHVWADITQRDAVIFYNNDFEIFIDPDGDTHNYYEFEMNALNTIWDLFISKPYRDHGVVLNNWDYKGIKTAVKVYGTLNNPEDIDKKWTVEIAIPWKAINETYDERIIRPEGQTWRVNFSRVNWDFELINGEYHRKKDPKTGKYLPEYNWVWSPQWVINMHEPEHWGFVKFSTTPPGTKEVFTYDADAGLRLKLYEIYRKLKSGYNKTHKWNYEQVPETIIFNGKEIPLNLERHLTGYTLSLKSPFTNNIWYIMQDGKSGYLKP